MRDDRARVRFTLRAACIALCCALALAACAQAEEEGVVATQSSALRVREAPSPEAKPIAKAERGERVAVLEKSADGAWLRIRTAKGDVGWASARFVSVVEPEPQRRSGFLVGLLLLGALLAGVFLLRLRKRVEPAAAEVTVSAPEPGSGSGGAWALAVVVVVAALGAGLYFVRTPGPDPQVKPGSMPTRPGPQPNLEVSAPADVSACRDARAIVEAMPGNTLQEREAKELEARWIDYLEEIQAVRDHANWLGQPCALYVQNHRRSAPDALAKGLATLEVRGKDLRLVTVRVTVTSPAASYIVVPVGTLFTSGSAGTQDMMSAGSLRFVFAPVPAGDSRASMLERVNPIGTAHAVYRTAQRPRTLERDMPVYCINRWRDVPSAAARLTVSFPGESHPLRRLVSCLETQPGEHAAKQLAVWMISDNLLELTRRQLEDRIYEELAAKGRELSGAQLADLLQKADPSTSEDLLRAIRNLSRVELAQVREVMLRKQAQDNIPRYTRTEPLLRACGYDVSSRAFFRQ